jgi:hypothetical protein
VLWLGARLGQFGRVLATTPRRVEFHHPVAVKHRSYIAIKGDAMKAAITIALVALIASNSAFAASSTVCESQVAAKNLSGSEKASFMKQCEKKQATLEATNACDAQAKEQKLAGAAVMKFVNKCVKDATAGAAAKK